MYIDFRKQLTPRKNQSVLAVNIADISGGGNKSVPVVSLNIANIEL
jgi:hypothetical protein